MSRRFLASWMIWYAVFLHFAWAVLLLLSDEVAKISAIATIAKVIPPALEPWAMMAGSVLAIVGMASKGNGLGSLLCVIPQQLLLLGSAAGAALCIYRGHYADGYVAHRLFIAADQLPAILAAILHTFAILEYHAQDLWDVCGYKAKALALRKTGILI